MYIIPPSGHSQPEGNRPHPYYRTTFNPGDRVTVWHERFFCPNCIGHESAPNVQTQPSQHQSFQAHQLNGVTPSPLSITEDDEGCISAADASLSEFASPRSSTVRPPNTAKDKSVRVKENGESALSKMSDAKCISSTGNPQKSKSILRKTGTDNLRINSSSRELGYVSADSGLGDRLLDQSKTMGNQSNTPVLPEQMNSCENAPVISPGTVSSSQSRQSLLFRVPNSDYGRFLTQSYIHLNGDVPVPSHTDQYKRNVSFTTLNSSSSARGPKHFHLPESKSRFLPPGTKTYTMLFGRPATNYAPTHTSTPRSNVANTRRITPRAMASSATELSGKLIVTRDTSDHITSNGLDTRVESGAPMASPKADVAENEDEVTFEARRLACFPSGHERDKTLPAPIERYDWPGPPASAVVLAELMRERRYRRREQARQNGTLGDEVDDFESQEALSIDYSFDGTLDAGIGQAILREEAEQKRRSRSHQFLDPVSASRSPNAATEPLFKPRYATHQFACTRSSVSSRGSSCRLHTMPVQSGQSVRPGYTGGRLSVSQKTASLPASSLLLNSGRLDTAATGWQLRTVRGADTPSIERPLRSILSPSSRPYYHSVYTLPSSHRTDADNFTTNGHSATTHFGQNGHADSDGNLLDSMTIDLGYPKVICTPKPNAAFHKHLPPPPKVVPYEELRKFGCKTPRGFDRTALETYLSDEEFQRVLRLSRSAFYRLPEWKRNDLKRRADLF
ncbi:hypothetical protein PHET_02054 [Paragonimus heterotremus]|uniref:HP domain-containing protein n=1 Tax=Paragonimus heterotremus TaxID=100268 RepID=A0A8J4TM91_9TREM|nr:hypothetical protein PHET_02054 [Paragonimus heterotremus]